MKQSFEEFWNDAWHHSVLFPIEAAVALGLIALLMWRSKPLLPTSWWRAYVRFALRRRTCLILVFLFTLLGHYAVEPSYVKPVPGIHDEFSYLLAADTFASGRITNPAHPMRYFFETMHVLMEPTYMSMYPPMQGLALSAGAMLTGDAIGAVWLTVSLMCAAVCWMLQGWLRPHWALTGGLLCAVRIGWFSYWANSYWGGAVAAIGGALVGGAIPRLLRKPNSRDALILAAGALILANSRPFEGAVFALTALAYLLFHVNRRSRKQWLQAFRPAIALGFAGAASMAYYNYAITGNALQSPYLENRRQYQTHGSFFWSESTPARTYQHEVMRRFYTVHEEYTPRRSDLGRWPDKPLRFWMFYIGPALTLTLFGIWGCFRTQGGRFALLALTMLFATHQIIVWDMFPHYAAPVVGAFYLLLMVCLRSLTAAWRRARFPGRTLARAALLGCALMVPVRSFAPAMGLPVFGEPTQTWYNYGRQCNFFRARIEDRFTAMGGKHLILVQYDANHPPEMEWVYNRANIDAAAVVWARYVPDPSLLARLLAYYQDRRIWIIFPDRSPNQIFDFKEQFR